MTDKRLVMSPRELKAVLISRGFVRAKICRGHGVRIDDGQWIYVSPLVKEGFRVSSKIKGKPIVLCKDIDKTIETIKSMMT